MRVVDERGGGEAVVLVTTQSIVARYRVVHIGSILQRTTVCPYSITNSYGLSPYCLPGLINLRQ